MGGEIPGYALRSPRGAVRRSRDGGHVHVGTDARRDHVLGYLPGEPNTRVVARGDDAGQAEIDRDLDLEVRVLGQL